MCIATINIRSDNVIFKTKKISSRAMGNGNTSIATKAIMPNGNNELMKFGPIPLAISHLPAAYSIYPHYCQNLEH